MHAAPDLLRLGTRIALHGTGPAGLPLYREHCEDSAAKGYEGFALS